MRVDWIESISYANQLPACMYQGALKQKDGGLRGWTTFEEKEWLDQSVFSVKQDTRLLGKYAVLKAVEHIKNSSLKHDLKFEKLDYFLPHISSMFFYDKLKNLLREENVCIPEDNWFTNLSYVGNVGSASIYLMLNELFHSGKLKNNQSIFLFIPESGRFSYTTALLTVVNAEEKNNTSLNYRF